MPAKCVDPMNRRGQPMTLPSGTHGALVVGAGSAVLAPINSTSDAFGDDMNLIRSPAIIASDS